MRSLEVLNRAIQTAEDLQSIVRTMRVLAAVSIRQYERAVESLVDYTRTVDLGMQAIARHNFLAPVQRSRSAHKALGIILFGSDHGLCGRFNEALAVFAMTRINAMGVAPKRCRILAVGARMAMVLEGQQIEMDECFFIPGSVSEITASVQQILVTIDRWQTEDVANILLCFNKRVSAGRSDPTMLNLLPMDLESYKRLTKRPWPSRSIPMYTMADEQLLSSLVRQYLFISIFQACAESLASEHASRLVSMQVAETNIKQRIEELGTEFRQQRQNTITEELLDVVAGYEALTS